MSDFNKQLICYLNRTGLKEAFDLCHLNALKDMINPSDLDQLAFLVWYKQEEFEKILNDGYLLSQINLDDLGQEILKSVPKIQMTGFAGYNPLGGPRGSFNETVAHYSLIKFIGQYTNSQEVYEKCLNILKQMPQKQNGWLMNPSEVMCLMKYNLNVDTSNNEFGQIRTLHNKQYSFNHSVCTPEPSQDSEWNRYRKDIQMRYYKIGESGNDIGYLSLLKHIMSCYSYDLKRISEDKLGSNALIQISLSSEKKLKDFLTEIKSESVENFDDIQTDYSKKIEEKLRFINKEDESEITSIFIETCCYVSDKKYNEEIFRKQLFVELFDRKLVEIDSKLSHNLIRRAADHGVLWIVQFLVERGCPTKNLPEYGQYRWILESEQLKEILTRKAKNGCGFSEKYMKKVDECRKRVDNYLVENNLI